MSLLSLPDHMAEITPEYQSDADVTVADFTIYGYKASAQGKASEIHELITGADLTRTIDGAPTLTLDCIDPDRHLAELDLLTYRITMIMDTYAFELAQIKKTGDQYKLVLEEVAVAEMRRAIRPRKVGANIMSRVEFAYLLLSELPPIDFVTPPIDLEVSHKELARGKDKATPGATPENTWKALARIFGEVKWRFWVDRGKVFAAPDDYLMSLPAAAIQLREYTGGVDDIDYDIDSGKKVDKATVHIRSDRWGLPIGARVDLGGDGPDQGSWIVSQISRSLFDQQTTVTLVRPTLPLPEPPSQPEQGDPQAKPSSGDPTPAGTPSPTGPSGSGPSVETAVQFALSKEGGPYVWGGTGPVGYDCSGLTQAAFAQCGVNLPRVSSDQYRFCADAGLALSSPDEAANIRGAILERRPGTNGAGDSGHIAISLGTGNETIEAMGSAYGIVQGKIHGRTFNRAAKVPGVTYG